MTSRAFYIVVDQGRDGAEIALDTFYNKADAERYVREMREEGYNVGYQEYSEAEVYGDDREPQIRRSVRAPKVGRRYRMRLR